MIIIVLIGIAVVMALGFFACYIIDKDGFDQKQYIDNDIIKSKNKV